MDPDRLRYEWRVWGERVGNEASHIISRGALLDTMSTQEIYLVAMSTTEVNPKIRDGRLDVKVLRDVADGCERWEPQQKQPFPLGPDTVRTKLFGPLGLDPPQLERGEYSPIQLIDEVVDPYPGLVAVEVSKQRRLFAVADCIGEVSDVVVAGRSLQTVAVESADLGALRRARRLLGLDKYLSASYPRAISWVIGWTNALGDADG